MRGTACLSCGWGLTPTGRRHEKIDYPRWLEWAHIIGGPTRKFQNDERHGITLCKLCHDLSHGSRVQFRTRTLPKLSLANVLWLKRELDIENYDRAELQRWYSKKLPLAKKPNQWWING